MVSASPRSTPGPDTPLAESAVARHATAIVETGFTVIPDVLPSERRAALLETVDRLLAELEIPFGTNEFLGTHTRRIFNLLSRDALFESVPVHAQILPVIERVLDEQCLLSSLTAIDMGPGETDQPIHADDGSYRLRKPHPAYNCTAIWALTDFTLENGATHIVQGSHRRDHNPRRGDVHETIQAEMPAGSALIYHGSLWHGGGANASNARRTALVCNYCAGFLRQEECQLLALPRELVAGFDPKLRQLVGYGTYGGLLGHVNQRDPATLLGPGPETERVWRKIKS